MTSTGLHVLGLSGGCSPSRVVPEQQREDWWTPSDAEVLHDATAALVSDGRIVAAIEEERLNRLKHTNKLARHAIRAALQIAGLRVDQLDRFAYYGVEDDLNVDLATYVLRRPSVRPVSSVRDYLASALSYDLEIDVDPGRLVFVEHHVAHAASTYYPGPFSDALVVTLDGFGDRLSGTVWAGRGGRMERLLDIPRRDSLGLLYLETTRYLGYALFDEYKVMGLAAYGDPSAYRHLFDGLCELGAEGRYTVRLDQIARLRTVLPNPRRTGELITGVHQDLAAAVQATIERATLHLLRHYRQTTGLRQLCLAGGVALNSSMVGAIARAGLFDGVFVQPAAHDAGCALGAALHVHHQLAPDVPFLPLTDVYLGRDLPDARAIADQLSGWTDCVEVIRLPDAAIAAAGLLADGAVIGWVQGRAEFGPRALGNRSILADPRPAANKDRINELVKQRESYRPFAPAVLEEHADAFFEMPRGTYGAYMTFTVPVRHEVRSVLGAVTHVDGTARVQTVSRTTNPRFWSLIEAFRARTGVPVLLNTSFNHSVEPIVDSIDDAVTCLLTTGLTHLVVGDYLVTRGPMSADRVWRLVPCLPEHVRVVHAREADTDGHAVDVYRCERTASPLLRRRLSPAAYQLLARVDGVRTCEDLRPAHMASAALTPLRSEIESLWADRLVHLLPVAAVGRGPGLTVTETIAASETFS